MTAPDTSELTRISDVQYEPNKLFMPIEGYEKMPLLPLETVIVSLYDIVPDIQRKAYIAKERCKNPPDNLTPDESASIFLYTMEWSPNCVYSLLNRDLRSEDRRILFPWFSYLKLLLTALWKLPSTECTVWRGVKLDLSSRYLKDEKYVWWGFSSTTTQVETLKSQHFLGQTGTRTLFNIECKNGKIIRNHSYYQHENEVLLLPATQLQVCGVLPAGNGLHIIDMKEVQPPFPMLEPPFVLNREVSRPQITHSTPLQPQIVASTSSTNGTDRDPHRAKFATSISEVDIPTTVREMNVRLDALSKGDFLTAFQWDN